MPNVSTTASLLTDVESTQKRTAPNFAIERTRLCIMLVMLPSIVSANGAR